MTSIHSHARHGAQAAEDAGRYAAHVGSPFLEKFARFGYAAKGTTYIIVGILAAMAAFGSGSNGQVAGSREGLASILAEGTWGSILVGAVGIGLIAYALWNLTRSFVDVENQGTDAKGIAKRVFFAVSGIIHGVLGVWAIRAAFAGNSSGGGSGGGGGTQDLVGRVLEWPGGTILIFLVGLIIIGFGLQQFYKAYAAQLGKELALGHLSATKRTWAMRAGRFGLAARGLVAVIIGSFFLQAAWYHNQSQAGGLGEALRTIQDWNFGWLILGITALGLIAYGLWQYVKAAYRRIDVG